MTSLSQRSSGLVQRRTEASRSAAADKERPPSGEEAEPRRGEEPEDGEQGDSKETRLTLMEEVLLLGLKDREVNDTAAIVSFLHTAFLYEQKKNTTQVVCVHPGYKPVVSVSRKM